MIYGIIGTLMPSTPLSYGRVPSKKGNGKTAALTYFGYREHKSGRRIISNYHTTFSEYMSAQDIFDGLTKLLRLSGELVPGTKFYESLSENDLLSKQADYDFLIKHLGHSTFLLSELGKFFNSLGTSTKVTLMVEGCLTQLRKIDSEMAWDSQRPNSVNIRLREYTETWLMPVKIHKDDESICDHDRCNRHHLIKVYSEVPYLPDPIVILDAAMVGQLYKTNEIIGDMLVVAGGKK